MPNRKLIALLFCLLAGPALAGYMTLLGAGAGGVAPAAQGNFIQSAYSDNLSSLNAIATPTFSGLATQFDSTGTLTYRPNNLLQYGNMFSSWRINNAGVTFTSGQPDPDGGNSGWLVTGTGAGNPTFDHYPQDYGGSQGLNQVLSINVKAGTASKFGFADVAAGYVVFDLSNGTVFANTSGQFSSPTITPLAGGWYRVSVKLIKTNQFWYNTLFIGTSYAPVASTGTVYVYKAALSAVTYETTPRTQDQVITTSAAYYGPRFDYTYNGSSWVPAGLLVEGAATNLLTYSSAFDNAAWAKLQSGGATVTADQTTSPDGTTNADKVIPNAVSGFHSVRQGAATTAAVHTQSIYYKPLGYTKVGIREDFVVGQYAAFDCSGAGSVLAQSASTTATITARPDGWYKLTFTPTTASANMGMGFYIMDASYASGDPSAYSYTGDGTSGGYVWGADIELSTFATSYIPTGAAAVTRAADVVQLTGTAASALRAAQGSVVVQVTDQSIGYGTTGGVVLGGSSTYWLDLASGNMYSNSASHFLNTANAAVAGSPYRAGVAWNASGRSLAMNGGTVVSDAFGGWAGTTPYLGSLSGTANFANAHFASLAIYNSRLPDATLQVKSVVGASYAANDNGIRYAFADNDNLPVHWRVAL